MRTLAWSLPDAVREEIGRIGTSFGFTAKQTFSFRRGLLKCTMGMKAFMALSGNDDAKARLIAEAFESEVERSVRDRLPLDVLSRVNITTEAQRKAAAAAEHRPCGPTPDLTFDPPIRINGRVVAWIDAKMLYASRVLQKKRFMPENQLTRTAEKYNAVFGPGAFIFGNGFCAGLEDEVPAMLLDSTPLNMERFASIIESDQSETAMTLDATRVALRPASPTPLGATPTSAQTDSSLLNSIQSQTLPGRTRSPGLREDSLSLKSHILDSRFLEHPHNWSALICCGTAGNTTYHYHVCQVCGCTGIRRKVSNKKAVVYTNVLHCNA
jgi:hypothetical protein